MRARALLTRASLLFLAVVASCSPTHSDLAISQNGQAVQGPGTAAATSLASWIAGLQYQDSAKASYGAIRWHQDPAYYDTSQAPARPYYRVVPYRANLALLGLLRTRADQAATFDIAERWIGWYLGHLNPAPFPDPYLVRDTVYDYWYLADGGGESACPAGIAPALCDYDDASDSYAATFLGMVQAYQQVGGTRAAAFLNGAGVKDRMERVAAVITSLQDQAGDGLTWARGNYHVKYLMDASEVYWGLTALSLLEANLYSDAARSSQYQQAAQRVWSGIASQLYGLTLDSATGTTADRYRWARFEDGSFAALSLDRWWVDNVAQVWPLLFGVRAGGDPISKQVMGQLNARWDGSAGLDWTLSSLDGSGGLWPAVGYAAALAGDCVRAHRQASSIARHVLPGLPSPFTVDDAGWLLMALDACPDAAAPNGAACGDDHYCASDFCSEGLCQAATRQWEISCGGTGEWAPFAGAGSTLDEGDAQFGEFDGDGRLDVLHIDQGRWFVLMSRSGAWELI